MGEAPIFFLKKILKWARSTQKTTKNNVKWARSAQKSQKTCLNGREAPEIFGTHGLILVPVVLVLVPMVFSKKKLVPMVFGTHGFETLNDTLQITLQNS